MEMMGVYTKAKTDHRFEFRSLSTGLGSYGPLVLEYVSGRCH
jgi:hypothetical protein